MGWNTAKLSVVTFKPSTSLMHSVCLHFLQTGLNPCAGRVNLLGNENKFPFWTANIKILLERLFYNEIKTTQTYTRIYNPRILCRNKWNSPWLLSSVTEEIVFNFDMNFPCPIKIKSQGRQQKPPLYGLFRLHIKMVSWGLAQKCV